MDPTETSVLAVRSVGPEAVAIDLATPEGFEAAPGQFVKLSMPVDGETESRFYTISSPDVTGRFELTVEADPEGTLAPLLVDAEPGDTVTIAGPFGQEYYDGEASVLVLAGGPGVGPAVGIAEAALADGNEVAVVYADDQPLHEPRLAAAAAAGARIVFIGAGGDLAAAVAEVLAPDQQVFVYGFAEFISDATDALAAAGGDPSAAKIENFG
jgi:3-phenylpropionate/trans-cinnamate dioxygenase ferredoxin reductase subunit